MTQRFYTYYPHEPHHPLHTAMLAASANYSVTHEDIPDYAFGNPGGGNIFSAE